MLVIINDFDTDSSQQEYFIILKYVGLTLQLVDQNIYKNLPFSYTFNYNSAGQTCYNFVNPYFSLYVMNDWQITSSGSSMLTILWNLAG